MKCVCRMVLAVLAIAVSMSVAIPAQSPSTGRNPDQIRALQASIATAPAQAGAATWLRLAVLCQDAARYKESEQAYRKAIGLLKSSDRASLAMALDHMGTMFVETGRFAKAEPLEQKALEIRQALNDSTGVGISYMHLAVLSLGKHDLDAAEADAEMAVSLIAPTQAQPEAQSAAMHVTPSTPSTPEQQMAALIDLSLVRCARGSCATAVPHLTRALTLAHANYQANSVPVGFLDFLLGYANWKNGNSPAAAQLMKTGTSELESQLGWGHPTYIAALKQYHAFLIENGEPAAALQVGATIAGIKQNQQARPQGAARVALSFDQLP